MNTDKRAKGNEILIALIGLMGVLVTAGFSNWDKIFPDNSVIQAKYSGYRPTDNFETELRHYFNVSGARQAIDNMQKQLAQNMTIQLSAKFPEDSEEIKKLMEIALEEAVTLDEVLVKMIPVYRNHFTLQELQELNKFYSTEIMQNMTKKMPLLVQEAAPHQVELMANFQKRFSKRAEKILEPE
ncbi:DUF2059 domain-containing protein [Thalassomonas viridans]|uniref:DUF2059 domain-containing protein n=1 Tax=Thalassomonas viridans TaxID=137584 RepID=A0AAF0C5H7_9GAMM|nr:DUF2059 domain-containing protein [Thalassomonas viridans]WDE03357.1 DUF2059 domain-containing protein [Thalassomonas viridans]